MITRRQHLLQQTPETIRYTDYYELETLGDVYVVSFATAFHIEQHLDYGALEQIEFSDVFGARHRVPAIYIYRIRESMPVSVEIDSRVRFTDEGRSFNVIAELPGSDKRDEVVILGAHFDSWASGTGATDNAGNGAVLLEALRILHATGLPLRRTVRVALWTGEEQYYLGSGAYAREHFGVIDSTGKHFTPEHARVSAYFNLDGGGGAIRDRASVIRLHAGSAGL